MKIVFCTSEMVPYAKTGGLADVCGSLPAELALLGHDVKVILPRYRQTNQPKFNFKKLDDYIEVPLGNKTITGNIYSTTGESGIEVLVIDNPDFFDREQLYGTPQGDYPDNDKRFIFFQRAALETLKKLKFKPDIIHCHDWQTGLIPVYLKTIYAGEPLFKKAKVFFTIHNLAFQGNFPPDTLPTTGLGWSEFTMEKLEFYGKVSFLKGGLVYSDMLTTVSERYAQEIQTETYGCGMDGILKTRTGDLYGVVNGIDQKEWNSETDPDLAATYTVKTLDKKLINKGVLQKENGLSVDSELPLFGLISRLADQKGLDILAPAMESLAHMDIQFVLLGTGEEKYNSMFRDLGKRYPKKFGINIMFDAKMAKRIYGGVDVFLMPSFFEPCGLGQMIAMRYGTIPLVRSTGGLADTVCDFNSKTGKGNGFVFSEYTTKALLDTIGRAVDLYHDKKNWKILQANAMTADFSWKISAKKYIDLYKTAERRTVGVK